MNGGSPNGAAWPLPLGEKWLESILVYSGGETSRPSARLETDMAAALDRHLADHPEASSGTVWFDTVTGTCFSSAQFRGGPDGKDYNFLSPADRFIDGPWGHRYVTGSIGFNDTFRSQTALYDTECIRSQTSWKDQTRNRRVMIVLGGPSTRRVCWDRVDADVLWSCNKFYLNRALCARDFSLISLAPDVRLHDNAELDEYLEAHPDVKVAFEIDRGGPVGSWRAVNEFVSRYPDRCSYFHPRYQSALGLGTRLLLLAIFMGAAEILFVGLDGIGPNGTLHSFEPYKENPLWYSRYGADLQRRQYVIFWEYVLSLRDRIGFGLFNLGEPCSVNHSRTISARHFPLPPEILAALNPRAGL
jgi:hypothetical protein